MSHNTLSILLWTTFIGGTIIGCYLFVKWIQKKWKKIDNSVNKGCLYSIPGLIVLLICMSPSLYFNYLLKKERYCISIIQFNKNIQKDDPFLTERCSCLDINELFDKAKSIKE